MRDKGVENVRLGPKVVDLCAFAEIVEHVEAKRERVVRIDEAVEADADESSGFDRPAAFGQKPHDRIVNVAGAIEPQSDDRAGVEVELARAAVRESRRGKGRCRW